MSELVDRFSAALTKVSGRVVTVLDDAAARAWIEKEYPGRPVAFAADQPDEDELRAADVGVDRADLLLADTGTVVKTYESRGASRISLVPDVSIFMAEVDRIVPGYAEAFGQLAESHGAGNAYTVLITGPSRTADIEKTLVIPAHGPRELVVILTTHP